MRAALTALALLWPLAAAAQDWTLEVVPDPRPAPPLVHEMVLITIRGHYGADIAIESLQTPALPGFGWSQLGRDHWSEARERGLPVRIFERRMAVFPDRAGVLQIAPFVHHLTRVDPTGRRWTQDITSAPVALSVAAPPDSAGWWLPVQALTATDSWEGTPQALRYGQTATRTVVLEAKGISPDRLPPMPDLRVPGIFAFPLPEERSVTLTDAGPVARAVWRWSVLPDSPRPAVMPPLTIPWFDTGARQMRELVLAAQAVSIDGALMGDDPHDARLDRWGAMAAPIGLALGLALGLGFGLPGLRWRAPRLAVPRPLARWRLGRQMARAARAGDATAVLRVALRQRRDGGPALAALTARVFGRPRAEGEPLTALVTRLRRAWRGQ